MYWRSTFRTSLDGAGDGSSHSVFGLGLLGVLGIVYSTTTTVVSMYLCGGTLVAAALIEAVSAFLAGKWSGFFSPCLVFCYSV